MLICEFCGVSLKNPGKKIVEHVNISQSQRFHQFCSQICKDKWCLQLQKNKSRLIVVWSVGSFVGRFFFVKKLMKVRSPSLLGSETCKSYFKSNFHEVDQLEVVNLNGRKVLKVKT